MTAAPYQWHGAPPASRHHPSEPLYTARARPGHGGRRMPRTLITGAAGFIGSHVTQLLVARGDEVRVTVRPATRTAVLEGLPVEQVRADVCDRRAVRRAMRGVDRVFHIAGTTSRALPRERAFAAHVQGTGTVREPARRA